MIEILLSAMSGLLAWVLLKCFERRDPVVASRMGELRISGVVGIGEQAGGFRAVLGRIGRRYPGSGGEDVRRALDSAGMQGSGADGVRGAQICCAAAGFAAGLAGGSLALVLAPAGAFTGFRLPGMMIARRTKTRREKIALALPDAVDLLAVCSQAGLNIALSLQRVSERTGGVLGEELRRTLDEIELGVARRTALAGLAQRYPHPDLESLVGVLENAERFGNQVCGSLEAFASQVRSRRKRRAEEQARKAPVKILFPLVLLILPAFMLLSVVPLLLSTFASLGL